MMIAATDRLASAEEPLGSCRRPGPAPVVLTAWTGLDCAPSFLKLESVLDVVKSKASAPVAIYGHGRREEPAMFTDEDVDVVSERLRSWSEALRELAGPELCRSLLAALDAGDGEAFHGIVGRWGFLERASCVEIAETFTKFVHTGDY
jgi:hypothetical protein